MRDRKFAFLSGMPSKKVVRKFDWLQCQMKRRDAEKIQDIGRDLP